MSVDAAPGLVGLAEFADASGPGLSFAKGEGTGNDFVLVPDRRDQLKLTPELVRRHLSSSVRDRRRRLHTRGTGSVRRLVHGLRQRRRQPRRDVRQRCPGLCAQYLVDVGWAEPGEITLRTRGGARRVVVPADPAVGIAVDMGPPRIYPEAATAVAGGERLTGMKVAMGNPHLVCPVEDPARIDLREPPTFSSADFPDGVNVEVFTRSSKSLVMRVYERGSGETLSCGTGACAVAVAEAAARGASETDVLVDVPGGRLRVVWEGASVMLHGPAQIVAAGRWWG